MITIPPAASNPDVYRLALITAQRGALLRQAAALIVQSRHMEATIRAELDAEPSTLPPAFCTDLRAALAQQDEPVLDAILPS